MDKNKLEQKGSASVKLAGQQNKTTEEQSCRICGCTWFNACPGGCYWVQEDLCSECIKYAGTDLDPSGTSESPF